MTAAIAADNLAAAYSGRQVWAGASFTIEDGSFTAVLGPNGSGKTTLIRMILGLLPPEAGRLEVFGRQPRRGDPKIGYIPQRPAFDIELSIRGRDFVDLGVDGWRWGVRLGGRAQAAAALASIDAVGASEYADRPLGRLSGGEQQRLLLAQALVGDPRLLLMDEPLSYLDVRNQLAIVQLIRDVAAGKVATGTPNEIITTERLSAIYSAPVEVIRDSHGRVFVAGLEEETSHPHA